MEETWIRVVWIKTPFAYMGVILDQGSKKDYRKMLAKDRVVNTAEIAALADKNDHLVLRYTPDG